MEHIIDQRIASLRKVLKQKGFAAFIIPSTDPHLSEYVSPHWKFREWISGFNGSAGTIVVTLDQAGLWTDSRYFLQASEQLHGTCINLYREMLPETPSIMDFLRSNLRSSDILGIDGKMFSIKQVIEMRTALADIDLKIDTSLDPMKEIWEDQPPMPKAQAYIYDISYAGVSCIEKIALIRKEIKEKKAEGLFLSSLDEIAWCLNLRGNDVKCNPVIISYLLITQNETVYFISPEKLSTEVKFYLQKQNISICDYKDVSSYLSTINTGNILLNFDKTNYFIYSTINPECRIIDSQSPIALLKAIRNEIEISGIHHAMKRDGVALVKFLKWLENAVLSGQETEMSIDKRLHEFRAQQEKYIGESFDTIAGYKEHAAIVHYSATPKTDAKLLPKGFLLLDSGAQYLDGTTDITRTIALGELTEEEARNYTLVLKGHIDLAMAKFPTGTRGAQLDVLAHMPLWNHGMNYLHGTGHGVGHFLNVHEGPQSIRTNENPVTLQPGMVTSNEPGIYIEGSHGIRTENLLLVCKDKKGMFSEFLKFETITLCPICKKGIVKGLLTKEEINWFNEYHQKVYNILSDYLNDEEKVWLKEQTREL
ncbi:aminopeptidase P family protein [uncultured Bacteroides sp.]|uniref:aminopeptidase P family protein n=1 Tax=uncultured Bacteroides sp. TaxID=162156 RepID=UPI002AA8F5CE|nr:aminopeptidase P family protein [uncultured Bacteroides sp.]